MLYAAGFGTRMGALTADRPKPLIPVAGRTLFDHALALVEDAGIPRRVVNAHYRADQIRAHVAGRGISVSEEMPEILDTGGGLRQALPLLAAESVFTLNTDAVWTGANPLLTLARHWDPARMDALVLLVPKDRAIGHRGAGDFDLDPEGRLCRGRATVYTGAQILSTGLLDPVPDRVFSNNRLWDIAQSRGRLYGCLHDGGWCDVGYPEAIPLAEAMLEKAGV